MSLLLREAIGGTIRRARTERRRTLRDVSGEARVSLGYLSEIERGRKEPSSELLAAICDALSLPLPDLLDDVADALRPDHTREPAVEHHPARPGRPVLAPVDPALLSAVEEALEGAADAAEPLAPEGAEGPVAEPVAAPEAAAPVEGPVDSADAPAPAGGAVSGGRLVPLVTVGPGDVTRIVCSAA